MKRKSDSLPTRAAPLPICGMGAEALKRELDRMAEQCWAAKRAWTQFARSPVWRASEYNALRRAYEASLPEPLALMTAFLGGRVPKHPAHLVEHLVPKWQRRHFRMDSHQLLELRDPPISPNLPQRCGEWVRAPAGPGGSEPIALLAHIIEPQSPVFSKIYCGLKVQRLALRSWWSERGQVFLFMRADSRAWDRLYPIFARPTELRLIEGSLP